MRSAAFVHPYSPAGRADPARSYRWLHAHSPVHFDEYTGSWLLSGYHDCVTALRDPRLSAALGQRERTRDDALPASMLTTDGPEHARLRAPGSLLLGPAAVRAIAGPLAAEVDRVLADASRRHSREPGADRDEAMVDAGEHIGEPFARGVFGTLLAVPPADRPAFVDLAGQVSVNLDPLATPGAAAAGRRAMGALTAYLDGHLARLAAGGPAGEPPVLRFARRGGLDPADVLGVLGLAVVGGYRPMVELAGNALACLLPAPGVLPRLRAAVAAGDGAVVATAVEEVLRLAAPIPFVARVTTAPVRLSGVTIPAGARVLVLLAAASRDPAVFPHPDEPRLDRAGTAHLGLGGGPHLCLAAPLVRLAGRLLLSGLVGRFPGLAVQPARPAWDTTTVLPRRVAALRVRLC